MSTPEQQTEHWSVSVAVNGENILTIESNMLAGKPEFSEAEAETIRECARHLLAFIGESAEVQSLRAERDTLREALADLAIEGVTSGASPKKEGGMWPPLWHMSCRFCGARWSATQWKQPREHPPLSPAFQGPCPLAPLSTQTAEETQG